MDGEDTMKATVVITGTRLAAMLANDCYLFWNPEAGQLGWAPLASMPGGRVVASAHDFLAAAGYDELDDSLLDETFRLDVWIIGKADENADKATTRAD